MSRTWYQSPIAGWLLPLGFGVAAIGMYAGSRHVEIPLSAPRVVQAGELIGGARRAALADPARIQIQGVAQNCNGCHQIFHSASPPGAMLNYHKDVQLSHGMNNRCVNCHDVGNRESLTLRDGSVVGFAETPTLCAQCHGTVFRDWERGTHGKTLGSWKTGSDAQRRLSCNECHNPHRPKYDRYAPLPGPNTLRMGEQASEPEHAPHAPKSPLQRWLHRADNTRSGAPSHGDDRP